jgi:large subunit ribosomal protein L35Ae
MHATIVSFRRGVHNYTPRHFIAEIDGIDSKEKAAKFIGKTIVWKSPAGKAIKGEIMATHGCKGLIRAVFEKGLPGQAINTGAEVK